MRRDFAFSFCGDAVSLSGNNRNAVSEAAGLRAAPANVPPP